MLFLTVMQSQSMKIESLLPYAFSSEKLEFPKQAEEAQ